MGWFSKKEERAVEKAVERHDAAFAALFNPSAVTKEMALQIPTISGGIDLIANIIASTPIKLYREENGKAHLVQNDERIRILNDETGDTLNANEFWKAITIDYYTGKGGYAYINKEKSAIKSLHYVDESNISIFNNLDPIFKDFDINVNGMSYKPYDFLKVLRNTKDGAKGTPITVENAKLIAVAYTSLVFELNMARRGGNKKGFLKSEKKLEQPALDALKSAFSKLYSSDGEGTDNFVLLNNGIDFKESSNTSVELQLNENKLTNAEEFAKIFHISTEVIAGKTANVQSLAKLAAIPLMTTIQCALNKDLLLEREKGEYYFAFDTKELLKGDISERFGAYKTALDANFMQIDEVRYLEDLEALGLNWIKLGLQDVLYNPKTKEIFTPNTGKSANIENDTTREGTVLPPVPIAATQVQATAQNVANKILSGAQTQSLIMVIQQYQSQALTLQQAINIISLSIGISKDEARELIGETVLQSGSEDDRLEVRAQPRDKNGKFASGGGGIRHKKSGTKYTPTKNGKTNGIKLGYKEYGKMTGAITTKFGNNLKAGDLNKSITNANYGYIFNVGTDGSYIITNKTKIK